MAGLLNWLKQTAVQVIDSDRDSRIAIAAKTIENDIKAQRSTFNFDATCERIGLTGSDRRLASLQLYSNILERAWRDQEISAGEQKFLLWLETALNLDPREVAELRRRHGHAVFEAALATAFDDGTIDASEAGRLSLIAIGLGTTVNELLKTYFRSQGERFIKAIFSAMVESGEVESSGFKRLLSNTSKLGLSEASVLATLEPEAARMVEHVLADAKSDGVLSEQEDRTLQRLMGLLNPSSERRAYIAYEVFALRQLTQVKSGNLPTLPNPSGLQLRAGEVVHFHDVAQYILVRQLKSGPRQDQHVGRLTITDNRMIFSGEFNAFTVNHRRVAEILSGESGLQLKCEGKGSGLYLFGNWGEHNELAYHVYRVAIGRAHQTIVDRSERPSNRHIPRDVRQRVWQRCGGRCIECEANDYLEFDHIVPVAKGGSNSDKNVQLLCRRCNSKKSDNI